MSTNIKIAIAEPSAIIRCGLITILKRLPGLHIQLTEISTAEHLVDKAGCSFSLPKPAKTDFILNLILHILIRI